MSSSTAVAAGTAGLVSGCCCGVSSSIASASELWLLCWVSGAEKRLYCTKLGSSSSSGCVDDGAPRWLGVAGSWWCSSAAVGGTLMSPEVFGRCWCRGAIVVWGSLSAAVAAGMLWLACSCLGVWLGTAPVVVLCWPGWLGGVGPRPRCMRLGPSVSGGWSGSSLGGVLGPICLPSRSRAASGMSSGRPWLGGVDCVGVLGDPVWLRWLRRSWRSSTKAGRGWWGPVAAVVGWWLVGWDASGSGLSELVVGGVTGLRTGG